MKGGEIMKIYEIQTSDKRRIKLPIDITKENIDMSVDAIVSVMEEIMIAELYKMMILQDDNCFFFNIKIPTYCDGFRKNYDYQFSLGKIDMVINEIWRIDATLRLEVERDLLKMLL